MSVSGHDDGGPLLDLQGKPLDLKKLVEALAAGGYNAAPSKLRQGSLHLWFEDPPGSGKFRPGTQEEHDAEYDRMDAERAKSTP